MSVGPVTSPKLHSPRIRELDALRGIAALMVMVFHFSSSYDHQFGHHEGFWLDFEIGRFGVELFFMISGFVIFMTLERESSPRAFVTARFARLFPTYWFAVLFASAAVAVVGLPAYSVSWAQLIANLTMLQRFMGIAHIDKVYWTLATELAFYGWMIVGLRLGIVRRTNVLLLGWLGAWISGVALIATFDIPVPASVATATLLYYGHLFVAGILFYQCRTDPSWLRITLIAVTFVQELVVRPESIEVVGCWYLLFAVLIAGRLTMLNRAPLLFLGAISYPLYLVHANLGYVLIQRLQGWGVEGTILLMAVPVTVSITLATAVHYAVELPAQRALRRRFGARSARRREAASAEGAAPEVARSA
jgi:peptidoglycan/LPS O-acetylase OafA/YrhL